MDPLPRLLDANRNRAMEALRTLEDIGRFVIEDSALAAGVKGLRHDLLAALRLLPAAWLASNRSAAADVGRTNETVSEYQRSGLGDVAAAAASRLAESLRVIEEASKVIDPTIARSVERLRYRSYDLGAAIVRRSPGHTRQWRVCLLLTERLCRRPWDHVVRAALDAGVDAIQVREKELEGRLFAERVASVVELSRPAGVTVIVNDRPDIALITGADGVHLGQSDLSPSQVHQLCGRRLIVGMSTHNEHEAERAMSEGADYCGVGPMFETAVKPNLLPSATCGGERWLRSYIERYSRVPHLAIGGITTANVELLVDAGCRGVAVSTSICGAERPDLVARAFVAAFEASPSRTSGV
jgi:thiamine-phosphate pyrophosphorylase